MPTWEDQESTKTGGIKQFNSILLLNAIKICQAQGQNKKEARKICSEKALCIICPKIFKKQYSNQDQLYIMKQIVQDHSLLDNKGKPLPVESVTLDDPRLPELPHLHQPYQPNQFLKIYCENIKNNTCTVQEDWQESKK